MNWAAIGGGLATAASAVKSKTLGGIRGSFGALSLLHNPVIGKEIVSSGLWVTAFFLGLVLSFINFAFLQSLLGKIMMLILFPIVYKMLFQAYGENFSHAYITTFWWSVAAIVIPLGIHYGAGLAYLLPGNVSIVSESIVNVLSLFKIYILAWPLWMMIMHRAEGKLVFILEAILVILVISTFVIQVWDLVSANDQFIESYVSAEDKVLFVDTVNQLGSIISNLPSQGWAAFQNFQNASADALNRTQQYVLTGKSYEEQVDDSVGTDSLGLTFKSLDFSNLDAKYKEGQAIEGWAVLEASSLDTPIDVETYCKINPKTTPFFGETNVEEFTVYNYDLRDIICSVEEDTFEDFAVHEMRIFANFDYTTSGYVRRYFMKQSDLSELRQNNIDPINQYNIDRSDDAGKFTSGPVRLDIIKNGLLQGIDDVSGTQFIVGVRIDNNLAFNRDGIVKDISLLVMALPDGFEVRKTSSGDYACTGGDVEILDKAVCQSRCVVDGQLDNKCANDCDSYTHYNIKVETTNDKENNNEDYVKTPTQISCTVETSERIFEDSPIVIKNFRVYADYTYQLHIGKSFTVLEDPNYLGSAFKELSYCSDLYSAFGDTSIPNAAAIKDNAKEYVNSESYAGVCEPVLKAMVAFNYRSGTATGSGIGATGMNLARINSVLDMPVSQSEAEQSSISITNTYLNYYLQGSCMKQGNPSIDCALNHFYCGAESSCASSEVVIGLANSYAGS